MCTCQNLIGISKKPRNVTKKIHRGAVLRDSERFAKVFFLMGGGRCAPIQRLRNLPQQLTKDFAGTNLLKIQFVAPDAL